MPRYRNISGRVKNIIYRGRKMRINPNEEIDGPDEFRGFREFVVVDDNEKKKPIKKLNIEKSNIMNFNTKNRRVKNLNRKKVINKKQFNMIGIPNNVPLEKEIHDNSMEVKKALAFSNSFNKSSKMSIGICILSKDSYDLIKDCVDSIEEHVQYENTKIYIFDTGTKNQNVLNFYNEKKKNCKFIFNVINVGEYHFSSNYNVGISAVDTEYVLIQNNDTVAINDYISKLMKISLIDKVGICGPRMLLKNGNIQHDGQFLYDETKTKFINPGHVNMGHPSTTAGGRHIVDGITAAGVLINVSWYKEIGGFDENFKDIYQDVYLCMKNSMTGKIAICDRDSLIYHYDNTSRKDLWDKPENRLDMSKDHNYLFQKINSGDIKLKLKSKKDFSIITVCNNQEHYNKLLGSLLSQKTTRSFEVICIPNFNGEYKSCSEALNVGIDVAEGKYHIYCHQDIHFKDNWLERITTHINSLDQSNIRWGVLGIAGAAKNDNTSYGVSYVSNDNGQLSYVENKRLYGDRIEVDCLDELCLIIKSEYNLRFDEVNFDHWHWYGADFCLNAKQHGLINFAIDATCIHDSDGLENLKDPINKKIFIEHAAKLSQKWKGRQDHFRTMTSWFDNTNGQIGFFLHEAYKKIGYEFPKGIRLS